MRDDDSYGAELFLKHRKCNYFKSFKTSYGLSKKTHEVILFEDDIYVMYKELNSGTFGRVILAQNQTTGEWVALKIQDTKPNIHNNDLSKIQLEHQKLKDAGQARSDIVFITPSDNNGKPSDNQLAIFANED